MSVTVIGDAFIDIIVPICGIKSGETYHRNISLSCGGTANVAVQVAKLGEEAKFVGKVGNDALGLYFKKNLKDSRVKDFTFGDNDHPTGLCVSLVYEDGERSMVANRGANDYLNNIELESLLKEILKSKIVYFSGYSLLNDSNAILNTMKKCRGNCEIWFNPGAPNIISESFKEIIFEFVDGVILNLDEAKSITKKDKIKEIVAELRKAVGLSVVTLGNEGCIVIKGEKRIQVPLDNLIENADTTGAGDAFSAGFIVGRLKGVDESECAKLGHRVATDFLKEKSQ